MKSAIELLECPHCHSPLEPDTPHANPIGLRTATALRCQNGHAVPVEDGVLLVSAGDAPSDPWSRTTADYAAYQKEMESPAESARVVIEAIAARAKAYRSSVVLDLCTGRGALLFNLMRELDARFISVDMSPTIQKHNARYRREAFPDKEALFIAADATNLPLRAGTIELAAAFGMGNMLEKTRDGLREGLRVLQVGGHLLLNQMHVREDSVGWQTIAGYFAEQGFEGCRYLGIREAFEETVDALGVSRVRADLIREVVGDPDRDTDSGLFPYPGEAMTEMLYDLAK